MRQSGLKHEEDVIVTNSYVKYLSVRSMLNPIKFLLLIFVVKNQFFLAFSFTLQWFVHNHLHL